MNDLMGIFLSGWGEILNRLSEQHSIRPKIVREGKEGKEYTERYEEQ